jgi:Transposase DNA-binding
MDVGTPALTDLGAIHFGTAALGNTRRTRRLARSVDRFLAHPEGTLPDKLAHPPDLRGFYRLVNQEAVTHEAVLRPHRQRTLELMRRAPGTILVIQDTTELDYDGLTSLRGELGQLGNGSHRGYLCHNSLAVVAATGEVLGLADQILSCRPEADPNESRAARRRKPARESRLWSQASQAVGPAPEGRTWVDVCDRGADLFEYLDHKHSQPGHYVVRSRHDRRLGPETEGDARRRTLHEAARSLPERGQRTVHVPPRGGQAARTARVRVGFAAITVPAPENPRGEHGPEPLSLWVVYAGEIDPPAGAEAVEWILLTNVPVATFEEACERLGWYGRRWIIEEFHKGQKTGCGIERMQFTTKAAMEPAIAVLSVVAVILLQLRDASRGEAARARPATEVVPAPYVRVLSGWRYQESRMDLTVFEFFYALARLGGHQNRKCDGLPGWIVLWRGWTKLQAMVQGAEIVGERKPGKT